MSLLNLPNCLSLSRIVAIAPLAWAMLDGMALLSVALFALVVVSDVLDGRIARRRGQGSRFGTLLDHGADAVFVSTMTALAAYLALLPAALPVAIAAAFMQYLLDSGVARGAALRASRLGRMNGVAYFVLVALAIAVHHFDRERLLAPALRGLGWLVVATTLLSMAERAALVLRGRG